MLIAGESGTGAFCRHGKARARQGKRGPDLKDSEVLELVAKSHFRNGGANLPVCRGAQQGGAHHFGNDFWQSL